MKLPGGDRAVIEPAKIRDYLLSAAHPVGRFKAAFFASLGYDDEGWDRLRDDLLDVAAGDSAVPGGPSAYGTKYEVRASLTGPNGRSAEIVSVWIVLHAERVPRFVTAFPM